MKQTIRITSARSKKKSFEKKKNIGEREKDKNIGHTAVHTVPQTNKHTQKSIHLKH